MTSKTCIECGAEHSEACLKQGHYRYRLGEDDPSGVPAPIMIVQDYELARSQTIFIWVFSVCAALCGGLMFAIMMVLVLRGDL